MSGQKFIKNAKNGQFWKPEAYVQTVLPERSILSEQKLVKNANIEKLKWDILGDFRTLWFGQKYGWSNLISLLIFNFESLLCNNVTWVEQPIFSGHFF